MAARFCVLCEGMTNKQERIAKGTEQHDFCVRGDEIRVNPRVRPDDGFIRARRKKNGYQCTVELLKPEGTIEPKP